MKYANKKQTTYRNRETSTVKDAIGALLKHYRLQKKFDETNLISSWEKIMGKSIASRTEKLYIKDQKLFVKVTSSPLKNQLHLGKNKILEIFEREIGQEVVKDVVLL